MSGLEGRVGYVQCPSCEQTSAIVAARLTLSLCQHCGAALPLRRRVVTLVRQRIQRNASPVDETVERTTPPSGS